MISIITLKNQNSEALARMIEDYQNKSKKICKGSQIVYDSLHREFVAFLYFAVDPTQQHKDLSARGGMEDSQEVSAPSNSSPAEFIPNKTLLEKWKKQPVSKKTITLLKRKHKLSNKELEGINTQFDAYILLNSLEKEVI